MVSSPSTFLRPIPEELVETRESDRYAERISRRRAEWSDLGVHSGWRAEPGGLTYDYSDSQEVAPLPEIEEGTVVRHPRFGRGVVADLDGSGPNLKAVIEFESVGRKKVVVKYANLELG